MWHEETLAFSSLSIFCPTPHQHCEWGAKKGVKFALSWRVKGLKLDAFLGGVHRWCGGRESCGAGDKVPVVFEQSCFGKPQAVLGDADVQQSPGSIADRGLEEVSGNHEHPKITIYPEITAKPDTGLLGLSNWGYSRSHVQWDVPARPSAPILYPCCCSEVGFLGTLSNSNHPLSLSPNSPIPTGRWLQPVFALQGCLAQCFQGHLGPLTHCG